MIDNSRYARGDVVEVVEIDNPEQYSKRFAIVLGSSKPSDVRYHIVLMGTQKVQVFKIGDREFFRLIGSPSVKALENTEYK